MYQKLILMLLAVSYCLHSAGQNDIFIKGQIIHSETQEPLAFSTININGTSEGAVSNFRGYFEFTYSKEYKNDTLRFSRLGFKPVLKPLNQLNSGNDLIIKMEENVIVLDEVQVTEKRLKAIDIVNKVIENIPNNYPTSPYLLEGFTRSHKRECGKYVTLYEAAFEIYGRGYHKKSSERIFVKESRQSKHTPYYHSKVLRSNRNLFNSMTHINDVLFRSYSMKPSFNSYEIEKYLSENDQLIYVIKTNHSKHVTHTMYINADNYALIKVEMVMDTPEGEDWNPLLNKGNSSDSLEFKVTTISKTIQFEKRDQLYFTKYMDWLVSGKLYYQDSKKEFCDWGFRFETMFDKVTFTDVVKPSNDLLVNPRSKSDPPRMEYDEDFWNSYPLIKEFPVLPQVVSDLEVNGPIIEQYKAIK